MTRKFLLSLLTLTTLLLCGVPALATTAADPGHHDHDHQAGTFDAVLHHYEMVRTSLADDSLEGVHGHAGSLEANVETLRKDFDAEAAAVRQDATTQARDLLAEIEAAAEDLVAADGLSATRDAFYELSKPLVRYREVMTGDEKPHVVYCSMAKKSWLQVTEEIGNPYHGNSMKRCGAVVSK